jgi:dihydroxyacetone kinase
MVMTAVQARNDNGGWRLLQAIEAAVATTQRVKDSSGKQAVCGAVLLFVLAGAAVDYPCTR